MKNITYGLTIVVMSFVTVSLSAMANQSISPYEVGNLKYTDACNFVSQNTPNVVSQTFHNLDECKLIYKNAIRFAYAKQYETNIDNINCVDFLKNYTSYGINTSNDHTSLGNVKMHALLEQFNLAHVLPLLEPVLGIPITSLRLDSTKLMDLPASLCVLQKLELLMLYNPNASLFSFNAEGLEFVPAWICEMKSLKKIVAGIQVSYNDIKIFGEGREIYTMETINRIVRHPATWMVARYSSNQGMQ